LDKNTGHLPDGPHFKKGGASKASSLPRFGESARGHPPQAGVITPVNVFSSNVGVSLSCSTILAHYSDAHERAAYARALKEAVSIDFNSDFQEQSPFEREVLDTIKRRDNTLVFSRGSGEFTFFDSETLQPVTDTKPAYRLESAKYHSRFDFTLTKFRAGFLVDVIMIFTDPPYRGNWYRLRAFVDEVARTLFGLSSTIIYQIVGHAASENIPRHRLLKIYETLGCVKLASTMPNLVTLINPATRELFKGINPLGASQFTDGDIFARKRVPTLER
jgi:hypothetical protein